MLWAHTIKYMCTVYWLVGRFFYIVCYLFALRVCNVRCAHCIEFQCEATKMIFNEKQILNARDRETLSVLDFI